jgi:hypothetical protein
MPVVSHGSCDRSPEVPGGWASLLRVLASETMCTKLLVVWINSCKPLSSVETSQDLGASRNEVHEVHTFHLQGLDVDRISIINGAQKLC